MTAPDRLSPRQRDFMAFLCGYIAERGHPPTFREIGHAMGFRNVNAVYGYLRPLTKRGLITRLGPRLARSIVPTEEGEAAMGFRETTEADVMKAIQDYVQMRGYPRPLRVKAESYKAAGFFVKGSGVQGCSDLIGIVNLPDTETGVPVGRWLAIETKRPRGRVRPGQREFLAAVRKAGGIGLLADDLRVVMRAMDHLARNPRAALDEEGNLA